MPEEENKPQILNHDLSKAPKIDNVEILELIGQGGMALIYKAKQSVLDRVVAVKVLSDDVIANESRKKRFQLEAQLSSSLTHPNMVRTLGYGISTDGKPYLIMEYV